MKTIAIWKNEIVSALAQSEDPKELLTGLCDLFDCFKEHEVELIKSDQCDSDDFSNFLLNNSELKEQCGDELILLQKFFCKAKEVDSDVYEKKKELILQNKREKSLLMMIDSSKCCNQCVSNKTEYFSAREYQMKYLVKEDEFYDCAVVSFNNLYFHEKVRSSIKTLTVRFKIIQELIGEHLSCLNRQYSLLRNTQLGFQKLADEFHIRTRIECSPMKGRDKVEKLYFTFVDITGRKQRLLCELHTKLKYFNMDKDHQNRIYFYPPVQDIAGEKVLVAYIGKHL